MFLDEFYQHIKVAEAKKYANALIKGIDSEQFQESLDTIAKENEISVEIASEDSSLICSSTGFRDSVLYFLPSLVKIALREEAIANGGTNIEYFGMGDSIDGYQEDKVKEQRLLKLSPHRSIIYTQVFTTKSGEQLTLLLNSRISPVDATVNTIRTQIAYLTMLMIVLSVAFALIMARIIGSPIEKINRSAKELATGEYEHIHFTGDGYKEIAELADTLNFTAKELAKVEGLRRELIANVSHDLRTPLTLIVGYSEVMRDIPGENTSANAQIIIDEARRLTSLVNDMLELSKAQNGLQQNILCKLNLSHVVSQTTERFSKFCSQEGYKISFIKEEDVYVTGDELKLSQVIYNLMSNAINYAGQDKTVIVRQSVENSRVKIEVIDTGKGIEQDMIPLIWDRYYKSKENHNRGIVGTGLGLSIVKSSLNMHKDAEYGVESTPDQGSTFWFSLPIED